MKKQILADVIKAITDLGVSVSPEDLKKIEVEYPDAKLGDYSTNAAFVLAKSNNSNPKDLAEKIVDKLEKVKFQSIEIAGPGFINFKLANHELIESLRLGLIAVGKSPEPLIKPENILVEYFQPNIAKPLHIGHLRTAIIGDALVRSLKYLGHTVESDTHMGDWGTQFGLLILAYRKYGKPEEVALDPINKLNEYYIQINNEAEKDPAVHEAGKQEFVKLEKGDEENRKIWKQFVDWSMEKFLTINELMDILPFDHHWPESFYEDKMPIALTVLKEKGLLVKSQGAQIVNLESVGLGIAVIVKSDGGTTYLLRDLATFIFRRARGYSKQLYVVDSRQSHHYHQLFAILKLLGEIEINEGVHIDYGFISFKGEILSTRKGNMVSAQEVIAQAQEKVAKIIEEKNPDLPNKDQVIKTIAKGALKYYDLSHNRHSDIEFDWKEALDFEGNSGPYLQYTYARLSSIVRKIQDTPSELSDDFSPTEHQLAVELTKLPDIVEESMKDYLPNILANYLFGLANLINKFYHESPVISESDHAKRALRLSLVKTSRTVLAQGLALLGMNFVEEM